MIASLGAIDWWHSRLASKYSLMLRLGAFLVASAVLCVIAGRAHAQSAGVRYDHIARSALSGPAGPEDLRGSQSVLTARLGYPIAIGPDKRWILVPGLAFERVGADLNGVEDVAAYSFGANMTLVRRLENEWALIANGGVLHRSDLGGYDRRAWAGNVSLMTVKRLGPGHTVGFGAALSYGQGRWVPAPIIRYVLRTERWAVDLLAPTSLRGAVRLHPDFDLGLETRLSGSGATHYDLNLNVRTLVISAGLSARYRIAGPIYATLYGGVSLFHCVNVANEDRYEVRFDKALAPVFSVGIQAISD